MTLVKFFHHEKRWITYKKHHYHLDFRWAIEQDDPNFARSNCLKLSFFTMPIHPLGKPFSQSLKEDREAFILADKLGFAEAYCGEHTTDRAEIITSTVAFLASLAYETKDIILGTGTVNLPNSHPAASLPKSRCWIICWKDGSTSESRPAA